jgi:predicted ribosome quality control (RQC) complex YloA/Tae2 family protein
MSQEGNTRIGKDHIVITTSEDFKVKCKPNDKFSDIADQLFKKAKKVETTEENLKSQMKIARSQIKMMKDLFQDSKKIKSYKEFKKFLTSLPDEIRTKSKKFPEWKELFEASSIKKRSTDTKPKEKGVKSLKDEKGNLFYIGTSSQGNDNIYRKLSKPNDIWFHVQGDKGAHVLLKNTKKGEPSTDLIYKGAVLAFQHSKLRKTLKGEVNYTFRKFVKKPKDAPSGLVICSRVKTVSVNLDQEIHSKILDKLLKNA